MAKLYNICLLSLALFHESRATARQMLGATDDRFRYALLTEEDRLGFPLFHRGFSITSSPTAEGVAWGASGILVYRKSKTVTDIACGISDKAHALPATRISVESIRDWRGLGRKDVEWWLGVKFKWLGFHSEEYAVLAEPLDSLCESIVQLNQLERLLYEKYRKAAFRKK